MNTTSLSRKLLTRVLSFYFLLTFLVTCIQIGAEYINTKSHITSELLTLEKTFSGSLTRAVWELNTQQAIDIANGLIAIPMIQGITVSDENNQIIAQQGIEIDSNRLNMEPFSSEENSNDYFNVSMERDGLFGHSFPLIFEFSGRTTKVGSVTLLSSNEVIFNRIQVGIYFLIGNAMLKTAALVLLFSYAFSNLLTSPLNKLTEQINQFDIDDPEASKLHVISYENNELQVLQNAYNKLIDELVLYKEQLALAQGKIISANSKLDEQNLMLEQEVARKTSSLSTTMLKMEVQQRELLAQQQKLKAENSHRSVTEKTLIATNRELKNYILELNKAQERLLDAEKMAILGGMSAEVCHEINTPIGIGITSTSYMADLVANFKDNINANKLSKRVLEDFTTNVDKGLALVLNNLERASELVSSFKQVAVDQISDKIRKVDLAKYLDEIIHSLHPKLKKSNHTIKINCPQNAEVYCHAGAISQIFTNLILNAIEHGFKNINRGVITITVRLTGEQVHITFTDNGHGVSATQLEHLFDAFYTTAEHQGGTGLGTHIVHSLVQDTLNGKISASSTPGKGLRFDIKFNSMA
ncbi:Histidine kinase-, DNA gyrase B-, and HSP90-like ATPase [Colwellia chukchiensis]|uniref:histidine kinase n=1 Tax=Colwellia chukchiensis TaxID=641665 RepID=A0A1H7J5M6_9GAMM|nr:HAMP domain-containing sensor histidine kinase [Colwellia chukchiensis]SEK69978.1 Histidine kinase-, DNA gyrase B-, and HSP90-like ATPase [Colwellia chukchiensis]